MHGRNVPFSLRIAIAPIRSSNYELIEPVSGDSVYVEHLQSKGEGFHHTCIAYQTGVCDAQRQGGTVAARPGDRSERKPRVTGRVLLFRHLRNGVDPGTALPDRTAATRQEDRVAGSVPTGALGVRAFWWPSIGSFPAVPTCGSAARTATLTEESDAAARPAGRGRPPPATSRCRRH